MVLLGLLIAAASLIADADRLSIVAFANLYSSIGVLALLISSALAVVTYTASNVAIGVQEEMVGSALAADRSAVEFDLDVVQTLERCIWYNRRMNVIHTPMVSMTILFLLFSLVTLTIGVYAAVVDTRTTGIAVVLWTAVVLVSALTNLPRQLQTLLDVVRDDWTDRTY